MGLATIGGSSGGGAPPVADTTLKRLSLTPDALTGSSALSALSVTQTWNTTGAPTAVDVDVTDTASNAASLLLNLRVGGVSKAKIGKDGVVSAVAFEGRGGSGVRIDYWGLGNITLPGLSGVISWGSPYVSLSSPSYDTLQLGANHATTPTAQTIKAHDVVTGTGADLVLSGGGGSVANGKVCFGTHAAVGSETVTGYIEIKDAGGTVRKIAVIS